MTQPFCFLGLSGSLRCTSNSTAVLHGLQDALAPRVVLNISLAGVDDLLDEIRAARCLRSAA
jgi:hypothetical protein